VLIGWLLLLTLQRAAPIASSQASPGAAANQLHAAIVNGDVESLRYWLEVRRADVVGANASEPDVTPLERCLGLAAMVLDAPPAGERRSPDIAAHVVSLGVLQQMVKLLHEHGARLAATDRQHFSRPVLNWYDDTVSSVTPPTGGGAARATGSIDSESKPELRIGLAGVAITTDVRATCNGSGHPVYIANDTQLSVTATVTTYEDGPQTATTRAKSDSYTVDAGGVWRLGCDTTTNGRRVHYELTRWR
jgi:hypothetical protein